MGSASAGPSTTERATSPHPLGPIEARLRTLLPASLYARAWIDPTAEHLEQIFVHLRTLLRILYDQVPRRIADDAPPEHELSHEWQTGTLVFTDLAGFTPLLEANAHAGPEGVERVYRILNRYFAVMIQTFTSVGGDLLEFTGDAMLVQFVADARGNDAERAALATLRMQRAMVEFVATDMPSGSAPLGMRIGLHHGRFLAGHVGTPRRRDYVLFGEAVRITKAAEAACAVGRVCVTADVKHLLEGRFAFEERADGHWLIMDDGPTAEGDLFEIHPGARRPRSPLILDRTVETLVVDIEHAMSLVEPLATYVPRTLLDVMVESASNRRIPVEITDAYVFFVKIEGLDAGLAEADPVGVATSLDVFSVLFARIDAIVSARSGMLRKVTYQASGSDILVSFGLLNAHVDDAFRAADAAILIKNAVSEVAAEHDLAVYCRIGLACGPVFAAELGEQRGRREFNMISDTVNTAARLTARAAPGTILVQATHAARLDDRLEVKPAADMELKGKAAPMAVCTLVGHRAHDRTHDERGTT